MGAVAALVVDTPAGTVTSAGLVGEEYDDEPVAVPVALDDDADTAAPLPGFCAPHGWSWRQALMQAVSPPQLLAHWLPHSWQMKKGRVWENSVTLGLLPSAQMQLYVRTLGLHSLLSVVELAAGVSRQIRGHSACCCVHQYSGRMG